ncbi:cytochrome P-450 cyp509A1 [Gongronella butleri]|nr:cytochrome P-450 cyp509A1 [Gongronella butleri]
MNAIALAQWVPWGDLIAWYDRYLSFLTNSRGKRWTLGVAAVSLALVTELYQKTLPPKHLRHIPHINFFSYFHRLVISKSGTAVIHRELAKPILDKGGGMYLRLDRHGWVVHVSEKKAVKKIFMNTQMFPKVDLSFMDHSYFNRFVNGALSNVLLTNGDTWRRHRAIVNPVFSKALPVNLFGELARDVFTRIDEKHQEKTFVINFSYLMELFTLDAVGKAAFDFDFEATRDPDATWKSVYDRAMAAQRHPLFVMFPFLDKPRYLRHMPKRMEAHRVLDQFLGKLKEIIEQKRLALDDARFTEEAEKDLLTLMLESQRRGEGQLTEDEILGDLAVFFVAGHDTTSNAIASTVYWLARHPEVQAKARAEVIEVLCPGNVEIKEDVLPKAEHLKECVYLNKVIREATRLTGSVTYLVTPRVAQEDVVLNGTPVPKGTKINVNLYDLHHSNDVWKDAEVFDPDREDPVGDGLSWAPFASGARQCIGMNFSLAEQRVVLCTLLRRYTWVLPKDSPHAQEYITGNSPIMQAHNLNIEFTKRF